MGDQKGNHTRKPVEKKNVSKRFAIVTLFAGLTISALGNNLVRLVDRLPETNIFGETIYAASFLLFLVKYFVDDLLSEDDPENTRAVIGCLLFLLVLAWTLFFLAVLFLHYMLISACLWMLGLVVVSLFIFIFNHQNNLQAWSCENWKYLCQNIAIIIVLLLLLSGNLFCSSEPSRAWSEKLMEQDVSCVSVPVIILLLLINAAFFVCSMFRQNQSE